MNEVNLHRGRYPHLTAIECFVDGQFLTDAVVNYFSGLPSNGFTNFHNSTKYSYHALF
jgi:hypothetical protein